MDYAITETTRKQVPKGLVYSHISDRNEKIARLKIHRDNLKVSIKRNASNPQKGGGIRSSVRGFSRGSRKRCFDKFSEVRNIPKYFVTLTFPDEVGRLSTQEAKDFERTFHKRMRRYLGDVGNHWTVEHVTRKSGRFAGQLMPHFHLLIFDAKVSEKELRDWVARNWYEVVGSGEQKHLAAGSQVDRCHSFRQAVRYVSKYLTKSATELVERDSGEIRHTGRIWGFRGVLDFSESFDVTVTIEQLHELRRMVAKWLKSKELLTHAKRVKKSGDFRGWTVYGLGDGSGAPTVWHMILIACDV